MTQSSKALAETLWHKGVEAVGGYTAVRSALATRNMPAPDAIVAIGKAAPAMARAACEAFAGVPTLIVTKDGHSEDMPPHVVQMEASHPVPDARSLAAGAKLRQTIEAMGPDSRLLVLISGGASALAEDLVPGYTLDDLMALNKRLLAAGLDIATMNAERRKISRVKGGGLLSVFPGTHATTLAISDVEGDSLDVVGSGIGAMPDGPRFGSEIEIIASNAHARATAEASAKAKGLPVVANEECLYQDVKALAPLLGRRIREMDHGVAIFGGEPTVILPDDPGQGGRNQALALELAREIAGRQDLTILVAGTDGTDGPTDAAGGLVDGTTWTPDGTDALARTDSGTFLDQRNALFKTGPTGTNVMDLVIAIRN